MKKKTEASNKAVIMKLLLTVPVFFSVLVLFSVSNAATVSYSYDDAGRLTAADFGKGEKINYSYDNNGNFIQRIVTANPTLQDVISALQTLARAKPDSAVYMEADIDGDGKIGLAEVIFDLQSISKTGR